MPEHPHGRPPAVLYIHGGGFSILSKETHWVMGLAFARRGYVVFNIDYRLAPKHRFPAAVDDVAMAYAWLCGAAQRYGADVQRLVLAGESAGANLASVVAICAAASRPEAAARTVYETGVVPRAVVAKCGMLQVTDAARFRRQEPTMSSFINERILEVERSYLGEGAQHSAVPLANPLLLLEDAQAFERPLPPFFLSVGTHDPIVDDTRRAERALSRLGVRHEARYYEGERHAFQAFVFRKQAKQCWRDTYAFLDAVL
jgi:acetyl esterase